MTKFSMEVNDFRGNPGSIIVEALIGGDVFIRVKDSEADEEDASIGHAVVKLSPSEARELIIGIMKVMRGEDD